MRQQNPFKRLVVSTMVFLAALMGVGTGLRADDLKPEAATLGKQVAGLINDEVYGALRANAVAQSYQQWRSSGYAPEDVFQRVRALESPEAWQALCRTLSLLPSEDLALFEEQINPHDNATPLPCAEDLSARVQEYWEMSRRALAGSRLAETSNNNDQPLPSIEVAIDASAGPILSNGGLAPRQIAITLDDGPDSGRTPRILDLLANAGVRATFFEVGQMVAESPDIPGQVVDAGHTVGSHTWSHPELPRLSQQRAEQEITRGRDAVAAATGWDVPFFRFPYGDTTTRLQQFVQQQGMATFFWNMDSLDWQIRDPRRLLQNIINELNRENGGILLMHDIQEQTVLVLPSLLDELSARDFTTVVFVPY